MTDIAIDVDDFRAEARSWLAANLDRRPKGATAPRPRGADHKTAEGIADQRLIQRRMYEGGYAGITWPAEYGGRGLTAAHERAFDEEAAAYLLPDLGIAGGTTFRVCGPTMLRHGSPDFLRRHVPRILAGEALWVQFFSEPEAGSDLAGIRTRATLDGEHWVLNGSKIWSSGAYYADYGMCLARTNWDVPKHRGLTWFAVKADAPGVTIQPITEINGDAEFCQEFLDDVVIDSADVIGEVNEGWRVAQTMLVFERGGGGGLRSGRPSGLPRDLVDLARRAGTLGDPAARQLLARAYVNDLARHSLANRVLARLEDEGSNAGIAAYLKLATGTLDPIRARIAMQIGGPTALAWDDGPDTASDASLAYLNGRVQSIAGGTNEVQRNGIGERALGLPREPSFDTNKPFVEVLRDARRWDGRVG